MSIPVMSHILNLLVGYKPRGHWTRALPKVIEDVLENYQQRSEIGLGGDVAQGPSLDDFVFALTVTEPVARLAGQIIEQGWSIADGDFLLGSPGDNVYEAIYENGLMSGPGVFRLMPGETVHATIILLNSDAAGGVVAGDGLEPHFLAVMKGHTWAEVRTATSHLTSAEVQAALGRLTGVHDGTTAWVHVAQVVWKNVGGVKTADVTMNRNNVTFGR